MFIFAYALQLNIYLGALSDPLILPNQTGMLIDIFKDVVDQLESQVPETIDILYVDDQSQANFTLNFVRNYDQEKGIILMQDIAEIDFYQFDLSKPLLTENYIFIYPSLIVTLFTRVVWELFFNYILIIFPWIMFYANLMIFFIPNQNKSYSKKIRVSLQILVGNEQTNLCTLILKVIFLCGTFLISAIIFIDFIYVVGNAIQRQNFNSLNDLAMNQFSLCLVQNDTFILDMVQRQRDISYYEKADISECIDLIAMNEDAVVFVSEFKYGLFLKNYPQFSFYKYQLKYNSYKSYQMLMNQSIDEQIRGALNMSIDSLWPQKYDLDVRKKYLVQLVYVKSAVVSLIFSNKTFLLSSFLTSVISILFIQCSIIRRQCQIRKKKLPYQFNDNQKKELRREETQKKEIIQSLTNSTLQRFVDNIN